MYVSSINNVNFSSACNRTVLKTTKSNLKQLCAPEEVKKAKKWVVGYTLGNAGLAVATAQAPGFDEFIKAMEDEVDKK